MGQKTIKGSIEHHWDTVTELYLLYYWARQSRVVFRIIFWQRFYKKKISGEGSDPPPSAIP